MLEISGLHTYYGNIHALKGITMKVGQGEIVSLIGSNGAGKSTLLSSIVGITPAREGKILFKGKDITNTATYEITKTGISISPEGREVFPELTVYENLRLGAYLVKEKKAIENSYERVYHLFPRLKERVSQSAGTLSGGEQQMLAIGRALMNDPEFLLLDEPSLGLAPNFVLMIFDLICAIRQQGVTILLIEQNANMALHVSDRAYVLENGIVSMEGEAKKIAGDPQIRKAYLGQA